MARGIGLGHTRTQSVLNAMNITTAKAHTDVLHPQRKSRVANPGWFLVSPSVALLLLWMIVALGMTLFFSLFR